MMKIKCLIIALFSFYSCYSQRIVIEPDKVSHFAISYSITYSTMQYNPYAGVVTGIGVGLLKEIYDSKTDGYFSMPDMYANMIGIGLGISIYYIQRRINPILIFNK